MKHMIERMQYQYLTAQGMEFPNSLEGDLLKTCYEIFLKQKPPTFDEVVKAWEDNGYIVSVNFDDQKEITSVMQRGSGGLKHIAFNFDEFFIAFGQFVHDLTFEELQAINLTIRYLQAKEKENV